MDQSIWQLLNHGGGSMWVVVAFSIIALAVAIERTIALYKFVSRASDLSDTVNRCLSRGAVGDARSACERSPSPMADIFLIGYERLGRSKAEHVASAVHRERLRVGQTLRSRLWMLGTIGATAPFVGLFGTVVGIMSAMSGFNGEESVRFSMVSGPISEALIVTAAGILVAVEAVILFNYFSQRAGRIVAEMKLLTDEFLELLLETSVEPESGKSKGNNEPRKRGDDDGDRQAA
jgi:biopolymer transport protein ExbB/TolQ